MPWSTAFNSPVRAPGGREFKTLLDVGTYVLALPECERETAAWHTAAENLMQAAEHGGLWIDFARIATLQALHRPKPVQSTTSRSS